MSYRTIALVSCLLMVGCGAAPPPSAGAPPPAAELKPARDSGGALSGSATLKEEADAAKPDAPTTPPVEGQGAPPPPPPPRVADDGRGGSMTQAVVDVREPLGGKLTQDDIRRIVEKSGDVFGDCYTLGAGGKTKDFKGVVTVKATIGPNGAVNQANVTKSTANNVKVDACVSEAFKRIKFPKPQGGATSVVVFPVAFNGIEQVVQ